MAFVDDRSSVREFLPRLVDELAATITSWVSHAGDEIRSAFESLVEDVQAEVQTYLAGSTNPLDELDHWSRTATSCCYKEAGIDVGRRLADLSTTVQHSASPVETSPTMPPPPGSIPPWLVAGHTDFPPVGPASGVSICFGGPDWPSWAAAPYVLLHEVLNHAVQGPWTEACHQPSETDPFAEGWMDVVVHQLHALLAMGLVDHVEALPDGGEHVAEAGGLFAARRREREWSNQRRMGIELAQRFHAYLARLHGQAVDETFFRLSFQINASSSTHADRTRFVGGVTKALSAAESGQRLPDGQSLDDWIREYERTNNVAQLLSRTSALMRAQGLRYPRR